MGGIRVLCFYGANNPCSLVLSNITKWALCCWDFTTRICPLKLVSCNGNDVGQYIGQYTTASAYKMLSEGGIRFQAHTAIWKSWALLLCKVFMWLTIQYRLWTSDRRLRHGLQDETSPCFLCEQEEDIVDHLLLQCAFARHVWYLCFFKVDIDLGLATNEHDSFSPGQASRLVDK